MDKVKKLIMLQVPTSICNFRCHYCYLSHQENAYQGKQAEMKYSPEHVAKALSQKRLGGPCFINVCAAGETLLTKNIDLYLEALSKEGHYLEIVSNMTVTPMIDRILSWDRDLLKHVEFKCSFHYLELKKRNLLSVFAENVNKAWNAGASITVEVTPSDELIPYIEEVKHFSLLNFGALPQLTIARDERTDAFRKLTSLSEQEYIRTWESFDSELWNYKETIFGMKQTNFCYAGSWSFSVNLATGDARACYFQPIIGNLFEDISKPIPTIPIGRCQISHCFNGHAFLTFGIIPGSTEYKYADVRNRVRQNGTEWLQPEMKAVFNSVLSENNPVFSNKEKKDYLKRINRQKRGRWVRRLRARMARYGFYQKLHEWKEGIK